jgi:hypothetical protein
MNRFTLLQSRVWRTVAVALVTALSATACSHLHGGHDHGADHGALTLNNGQKWPTDAALRQGMSSVRALVIPLPAGATPSAEQAQRIATGVQAQVAYMVQNCKLEPKADAVLHVLIADLIKGADELGAATTRSAGLGRIHDALKQYPDYFAPSGW